MLDQQRSLELKKKRKGDGGYISEKHDNEIH